MIDGAVLVDKPHGLSSNAVLQEIKRTFGARKAGHAGTLDPLATGLLIALFGEATKFAAFLLEDDKEYLATVRLGERTSTGDAEGEVLERKPVPEDLPARLPAALAKFTGEIEQVPPMYSALKRDGVPLYALARRGETVERAARRVRIAAIEVLSWTPPALELRVRCSKGTYIRTLAEDLGAALGTVAHLSALRRTGSGRFSIGGAATPEALAALLPPERQERVISLEQLLSGLPREELDAAAAARFRNGQAVAASRAGAVCAVFAPQGVVLGLGRADSGQRLHPLRLVAASTQEAEKALKTCEPGAK